MTTVGVRWQGHEESAAPNRFRGNASATHREPRGGLPGPRPRRLTGSPNPIDTVQCPNAAGLSGVTASLVSSPVLPYVTFAA
jgi:hypothetical protein